MAQVPLIFMNTNYQSDGLLAFLFLDGLTL